MNEKINVLAVVVTYNRLELLKECVEALLKQSYSSMDILLVDNASTDGTKEYLELLLKEQNSRVQVLFLERNTGGAGGFYEGMKYAISMDYDWLWLMDDDTIPEPDACGELCKAVEILKDDKIGFLSSNVFNMQKECMNTPRMKVGQKGANGYADWNIHLDDALVKVNSATFCACFVSTEAVKEVGLPIKEYFIWGDDTEYTLRLSRYYGQGWLAGKSKVLHKRKIGKYIALKDEENPDRISVYFYYVRNYLINVRLYYYGYLGALAQTMRFCLMMIQILFGKSSYKAKKIGVIWKGIFAFWFMQYPVKRIKKRLYEYK